MIETRIKKIFDCLTKDHKYYSSKKLSDAIEVSDKTIQKDIKDLNEILLKNGARIISKRGKGYKFAVTDDTKFSFFLKNDWVKYSFEDDINSNENRIERLLSQFLLTNKYLKSEDLADELIVSRSQIQNDIKEVRRILKNTI
ncbi:MAG: HTH domain-containing protein [Tissierellia bacterium]|nr:HTH domain-containing protein [Tissierellia bacterium]